MTGGGEDDGTDEFLEDHLPSCDEIGRVSRSLYDDVSVRYDDELGEEAKDVLHEAINVLGVLNSYVALSKDDDGEGVRGRQEVREKLEELLQYEKELSDGISEFMRGKVYAYKAVLGEVEDL